jgi:hypothetical protein
VSDGDETRAQRLRLAAVEGELARLRAQCDLAMSAFKFDEANALQRRIEALEDERRAVAAALPEQTFLPSPRRVSRRR